MTLVTSDRPEPGTIIGWLRDGTKPVYLLAGGSADEDDDDDIGIDLEGGGGGAGAADEDDDDQDDDDAEEPKPKPKPAPAKTAEKAPTQEDITRLTGALEKERGASKAARAQVRELQAQLKAATKKPSTDEAEAAIEAAREEAVAAAEKKLKPVVVHAAAKAALLSAGLNATSDATIKRLLRTLDLDDIDVHDDGEVTGLDEQVDGIKEAFPELFKKKDEPASTSRQRAPRLDAAGKNNTPTAPKTTGELYAQQILGRS